jgi:hypothetical protein
MSAPSWYHGVTSCIVGALALVVRSMAEGLAGKGGVAGAAYAQQILGLQSVALYCGDGLCWRCVRQGGMLRLADKAVGRR